MNHLTTMVYVSIAAKEFSPAELQELLSVSRRKNAKAGITGMLLYKDGHFMQLLEGPHQAVRDTFEKIEEDARHHSLQVLLNVRLEVRNFERWSMGFELVGEVAPEFSPNYDEIWNKPFSSEYFGKQPHNALRLLLNFRKKGKPNESSRYILPAVPSEKPRASAAYASLPQ